MGNRVDYLSPMHEKAPFSVHSEWGFNWLRRADLNHRPSGYEPDELPDCSTPRPDKYIVSYIKSNVKMLCENRRVAQKSYTLSTSIGIKEGGDDVGLCESCCYVSSFIKR